jgi:predicted transcriptional regulator
MSETMLETVTMRLPADVYARLVALGQATDRKLGTLARYALLEYLDKHAPLNPPKE